MLHKKVVVTYHDVAKAFDSVWIAGLAGFCLYTIGARGKTWRILYKTYDDFQCRVRIGDRYLDWYTVERGIHQGGHLSFDKFGISFFVTFRPIVANS